MGVEIERKFLVNGNIYINEKNGLLLRQGYVSLNPDKIVRVRTIGNDGFITIKGKSLGISRLEYEYKIPLKDAEELIDNLCEKPIIEKIRFDYEFKGFIWQIDSFIGENEGLILAEIELENENTFFLKPEWIDKEVTYDTKYCNSNLVKNPYKYW